MVCVVLHINATTEKVYVNTIDDHNRCPSKAHTLIFLPVWHKLPFQRCSPFHGSHIKHTQHTYVHFSSTFQFARSLCSEYCECCECYSNECRFTIIKTCLFFMLLLSQLPRAIRRWLELVRKIERIYKCFSGRTHTTSLLMVETSSTRHAYDYAT